MSEYIANITKGPVVIHFDDGDEVRINNPSFGDIDRRIIGKLIERAGMCPTAIVVSKEGNSFPATIPLLSGDSGALPMQEAVLTTIANHISAALKSGLKTELCLRDGSKLAFTVTQEVCVGPSITSEEIANELVPDATSTYAPLRKGFFR